MTLRKQILYENMREPLFKLEVEIKQHKQLIDRSIDPTDPFYYHFDLYGGILPKTLVDQWSIFLSLLH